MPTQAMKRICPDYRKLSQTRLDWILDAMEATKPFVCCKNSITDKQLILRHKKNSHPQEKLEGEDDFFSLIDKFPCPCGLLTNSPRFLANHIRSAHHAEGRQNIRKILLMPDAQGDTDTITRLEHVGISNRLNLHDWYHSGQITRWETLVKDGMLDIAVKQTNIGLQTITSRGREILVRFSWDDDNKEMIYILHNCIFFRLGPGVRTAQGIDLNFLGFNVGSVSINFDETLDKLFLAGGLFSFLYGFWKAQGEAKKWMLIGIAAMIFSKREHRERFLAEGQKIVDYFFVPHAQGLEDKTILKSIFVLFALLIFRVIPNAPTIDRFVKAAGAMGTFSLGMVRSLDGIERLMDLLRTAGCKSLLGFSLEDKELQEVKKNFEDLRTRMTELTTNPNVHDELYCKKVKALHMEFSHLYTAQDMFYMPSDYRQTLSFMNTKLTQMMSEVVAAGTLGAGVRTEPVVVSFRGPAGIGKSHVAFAFIAKVIKKLRPECREWQNELYVRNPGQEFWDSYHGQAVTMYDDFGQLVDTVSKPNPEFLELIKSQNIVRFPLHMAAINDKSNTFFNSELIVLTTNLENFSAKSIGCDEALRRRIEINVKVVPKRVVNGKVVIDKHPDPRDYEFHDSHGNILEADQLLKDIFARLDEKKNRGADLSHLLNNISASEDFSDFGPQKPRLNVDTSVPPYSMPPPDYQDLNVDVDAVNKAISILTDGVKEAQGIADVGNWLWGVGKWTTGTIAPVTEEWAECNMVKATHYRLLDGSVIPVTNLPTPLPPGRFVHRALYDPICWIRTLTNLCTVFKLVKFLMQTFGPLILRKHKDGLHDSRHAGSEGLYDSRHVGLEIGDMVKHKHACVACAKIFEHTHVILHPTEQREKGFELCNPCRKTILKKNSSLYASIS